MPNEYNRGARGPINSWQFRAATVIPLATIGFNALTGQMELKDYRVLEHDGTASTQALTKGQMRQATRTVPAKEARAVLAAFHRQAKANGVTNYQLRQTIVNIALGLVGKPADYWRLTGGARSSYEEYCADFGTYVVHQAYQSRGLTSPLQGGNSYGDGRPWWSESRVMNTNNDGITSVEQSARDAGRLHPNDGSYRPEPGDFALIAWNRGGEHLAVIRAVDGSTLHTVEGDAGPNLAIITNQFTSYQSDNEIKYFVNNGLDSAGGSTPAAPAPQAAPAQSAAPAQTTAFEAGSVAVPSLGQAGGSTLSSTATPVTASAATAEVPVPSLVAGAGHTDQLQAAQPAKPNQDKAPRYVRHNLVPERHFTVPGTPAQQAFIAGVARGAIAAQQRYGVPASVTIAQAIDESGWGQSTLATRDHNLFGIKGTGPAGSDNLPTQENYGGKWVTIIAAFRVYNSDYQSIMDHGELLATNPAYVHAMTLRHNPEAFAQALTGVYATNPSYGSDLITTMRLFHLHQFDTAATSGRPASAGANASSGTARPRGNPAPGVSPRSTGQPSDQGPAADQVPVPPLGPVGANPVTATPGQPGQVGSVPVPGLTGAPSLTAETSGSGGGERIRLVSDVALTAPWWDSSPDSRPDPMPWLSATNARVVDRGQPGPPALRRRPVPPRVGPAVVGRPPRATGEAVSYDLVGQPSLKRQDGQAFITKGFKADVARYRDDFKWLSEVTGVPWEIIGAVLLMPRPKHLANLNSFELVKRLDKLAVENGVHLASGVLSSEQIDQVFTAYAGKTKIKRHGLTPAALAQLIRVPPGTSRPV